MLVTFLWATSFVLIKWGLEDIPALTFAGLRYGIAALILAPWVILRPTTREALSSLSMPELRELALLGVVFYGVTQGAQFLGLSLLPAVVVTLSLSFSPVLVALVGAPLLGERLSGKQWAGLGLFLAGALVYFLPLGGPPSPLGLWVMAVAVAANAAAALLGRRANRGRRLPPIVVTVVSMSVGAGLLLVAGLVRHGVPTLDGRSWLLIGWLAVVNTAFAFTLWNHTLRSLTAIESSLVNNTMLIQIAILSWLFLDEPLGFKRGLGILFVAMGAGLVQRVRGPLQEPSSSESGGRERRSHSR